MTGDGWPTGTVTFLFTDVEGSTQRWRNDETAMAAAMRRHDDELHAAIEDAGGVVFKHTGDGVVAAFASPRAGLEAAGVAQGRVGLPVRMGLHTGEAELRDGDYFGTTLNKAARVMDAGHGGQVLASATTAALLDDGVPTVDLGLFELKGLDGAERVYQIGDGSFPELRARPAAAGNIPRDLTEFVGREGELAQLRTELDTAPIVTLFGVGGTGKTRLSLEAALLAGDSFADGCWFVELGQVTLPEAVPFAISSAVGMPPPETGDVTEALVRRIADRQMLIVIDNCEHVVDAAADVIEQVAAAAPKVRMIATSREPLMIRGERIVPVGPLPDDEGVELFLERARAEAPNLVLDDRQREAVVALCRRLDGLPLAIELAAARVRSMTPVELVAGLDERFRLLVGNRRSRTERHQTMRATLDWSYSMCDPVEQAVFDRLAVFPAEFDGAAAGAVAGDDGVSSFDVQDALARLVDRSLIVGEAGDDGNTRFRMLETMRVYGREHLRDGGESDTIHDRFARYVASEISRITAVLFGPDEERWFARLDELLPDAVLALEWFLEHGEIDLAMHLPQAYVYQRNGEALAMVGRIVSAASDVEVEPALRAELELGRLLSDAVHDVDPDDAMRWLHGLARRDDRDVLIFLANDQTLRDDHLDDLRRFPERFDAGRPMTRYFMLWGCLRALAFRGRLDEARTLLADVEELARRLDSYTVRIGAIELRAQIARCGGDLAEYQRLIDQVVDQPVAYLANTYVAILARFHRIYAHAALGRTLPATDLRQAWDAAQRNGDRNPMWLAATATAAWLVVQDRRDLAVRFLRWAQGLTESNFLPYFDDQLEPFDLPSAPGRSDESIDDLLGELDFL